jgi:hypothetical protein
MATTPTICSIILPCFRNVEENYARTEKNTILVA